MYLDLHNASFYFSAIVKGLRWPCRVDFSPLEDGSFKVMVYIAQRLYGEFGHAGAVSLQIAKDYAKSAYSNPLPFDTGSENDQKG